MADHLIDLPTTYEARIKYAQCLAYIDLNISSQSQKLIIASKEAKKKGLRIRLV